MGVGAEVGDPVGAPVADFDLLLPLAGDNIYDIDASDSSPLIVLRWRRVLALAEAMANDKIRAVNFMILIAIDNRVYEG